MTVSTDVNRAQYNGNGATTVFPFPFRILASSHLVVTVIDAAENVTTLVLGTDYTLSGVGAYAGGSITLVAGPLAIGKTISLDRQMPDTQETSIRNQGTYLPEIHEDAFDKLTMLSQETNSTVNLRAMLKPTWLSKFFDAVSLRIANLADPVNAQDATPRAYVDTADQAEAAARAQGDANVLSQANSNLNRSLRVPESAVQIIPERENRSNSLFGWGDNGQPISIFSWTDTADLALKLAGNLGTSYINWLRKKRDFNNTLGLQKILDSLEINIWEFYEYVDLTNPEKPDWKPAIDAAVEYCQKYWTLEGTYYRSACLYAPGGEYYSSDGITTITNQNTSGMQSRDSQIKIRGDGENSTVFITDMNSGVFFDFSSIIASVSDITIIGAGSAAGTSVGIRLGRGDTYNPVSRSEFKNVLVIGFYDNWSIGHCFDSTFIKTHFTQFLHRGLSINTNEVDNSNYLTFINCYVEPNAQSDSDGRAAVAIDGSSASNGKHQSITFITPHIEPVNYGCYHFFLRRCINVKIINPIMNRNGGNGNTDPTQAKMAVYLEGTSNISFDGGEMQHLAYGGATASDSVTPLVKVVGNNKTTVFNNFYFYTGKATATDLASSFDLSEDNFSGREIFLEHVAINSFTSLPTFTNRIRLADWTNVQKQFDLEVKDGVLVISAKNSADNSIAGSDIFSFGPTGYFTATGWLAKKYSVSPGETININEPEGPDNRRGKYGFYSLSDTQQLFAEFMNVPNHDPLIIASGSLVNVTKDAAVISGKLNIYQNGLYLNVTNNTTSSYSFSVHFWAA